MGIRVIAGSARGRMLETLKGEEIVRPTTNRVKEAIFSSIQFEIEGRDFLDVFCGSGQMGIEALSRGAKSATFVDISREAIEVTTRNLNITNLIHLAEILNTDSTKLPEITKNKYDIAYLDPPYDSGLLQEMMPKIVKIMRETGVIICEMSKNDKLLQKYDKFTLDRKYSYGKICLCTYRNTTISCG